MDKLTDYIKTYDNFCSGEMCKLLIDKFENNKEKQILNGKTVRKHLSASQWTEMDISQHLAKQESDYLIKQVFRFKDQYDSDCSLEPKLPVPGKIDQLIIKRYDPNDEDSFELHFDSLGPVSTRYLVILWYLNDVDSGGETCFPRLGIKIKPKAGRLLIFPPYWMYLHIGAKPISKPKYIASTYFHW